LGGSAYTQAQAGIGRGSPGLAQRVFVPNELPQPVREVFEQGGYGCLAVEAEEAIVHVCHAPDADIEGFRGKPVRSQ
jgi:hypothetical protein